MRFRWRWICAFLASLPVFALAVFAGTNPDRFSDQFLRHGGALVQKMANNPGGVAAFLGVTVILLWLIIAGRCVWEAWRERKAAETDAPQSVAGD